MLDLLHPRLQTLRILAVIAQLPKGRGYVTRGQLVSFLAFYVVAERPVLLDELAERLGIPLELVYVDLDNVLVLVLLLLNLDSGLLNS